MNSQYDGKKSSSVVKKMKSDQTQRQSCGPEGVRWGRSDSLLTPGEPILSGSFPHNPKITSQGFKESILLDAIGIYRSSRSRQEAVRTRASPGDGSRSAGGHVSNIHHYTTFSHHSKSKSPLPVCVVSLTKELLFFITFQNFAAPQCFFRFMPEVRGRVKKAEETHLFFSTQQVFDSVLLHLHLALPSPSSLFEIPRPLRAPPTLPSGWLTAAYLWETLSFSLPSSTGEEQMRIGGDEGDKGWRDKAQRWK